MTQEIADWITMQLDLYGRDPPLNYLSAALQMAVLHLLFSEMSNDLDEESFTGALLGAFCESSNICAAGFPPLQNSSMTWRRHNKNGTGEQGESNTGADFTLIIRHSDELACAAIFQAKNGKSNVGSFDANHKSPSQVKGGEKELQFVRLKRHCQKILSELIHTKKKAELEELSWAHYLVYEPFGIYCSPLSSLVEIENRLIQGNHAGTIRYKQYYHLNFIDLLKHGCSEDREDHNGWLRLTSKTGISSFVKSAQDLYDVYEAHVNPGMSWTPLVDNRESVDPPERIEKIKAALRISLEKTADSPNSLTAEKFAAAVTRNRGATPSKPTVGYKDRGPAKGATDSGKGG